MSFHFVLERLRDYVAKLRSFWVDNLLVDQGDGAVDQLQGDVDGGADSFTTVATLDGDAGVNVLHDDNGTPTADITV